MKPLTSKNTNRVRTGTRRDRPLRALPARSEPATTPETRRLVEDILREERVRWAYEIHDGLTQSVAAAILQLEMLSRRVRTDPEAAASDLAETAEEMRTAMTDIRSILFNLTADVPDGEEPSERVRACVDEVAGRWKLDASLVIDGDLLGVPSTVLAVAQVVIHEALTNAAKHAGGEGAEVSIRVTGDGLAVSVEDHGARSDLGARRFGMRMMERRVREVGGNLQVEVSPDGTAIRARFPREAW